MATRRDGELLPGGTHRHLLVTRFPLQSLNKKIKAWGLRVNPPGSGSAGHLLAFLKSAQGHKFKEWNSIFLFLWLRNASSTSPVRS